MQINSLAYSDPFSLFSTQEKRQLNKERLALLRTDYLQKFSDPNFTIDAGSGYSLNKNQVVEIFDELEKNFELHNAILNNTPLYLFLTKKDLSFFKNFDCQLKINLNIERKEQINNFIAIQLNDVIPTLLENVDFKTGETLSLILDYSQNMSLAQQEKSYQKALFNVKHFVEELPKKFPHPFQREEGMEIHSLLDAQINPLFYKCFEHLPASFKKIGNSYAIWCHNNVVNNAFRRVPIYLSIDKAGLRTLSKAAEIGTDITTSDAFKKHAREIQKCLIENKTKERREKSTLSAPVKFGTVLFFIFFLFKVANYVTRANSSSDRNPYSAYYEKQERNRVAKAKAPKERSVQICKDFVGDNPSLWNPVLKKSTVGTGYVELDYEVAVFPTNTKELYRLIPAEMEEKEFEEQIGVVINLTHKDYPETKFAYRFEAMKSETSGQLKVINPDEKKGMDRGDKLTTKRMLKKKYLKGSISRYQVANKELLNTEKFEIITLDGEAEAAAKKSTQLEAGLNPTFEQEVEQKWSGYKMKGIKNQMYKSVILHNLNKVAFKSLVYRGYYAAEEILTYQPPGLAGKKASFRIDLLNQMTGDMLYYIKSNHDESSIIWVNGKDYKIRYFVNRETKRVFGMNMVVLSEDQEVVELIEVFFMD